MLEAVTTEIRKLPTTLEQDLEALKAHKTDTDGDFDGADGLSLILRCKFKQILNAIVVSATEALADGTVTEKYGVFIGAAAHAPVDARFAYFEIQL